MKGDLVRIFLVGAISLGLAIFGTTACTEDAELGEVQEVAEEVAQEEEEPAKAEEKAEEAEDAASDTAEEAAAEEKKAEAKEVKLSPVEERIIAVLSGHLDILEKCKKPSMCIKGIKKSARKDMKVLKKSAKRLKKPSAGFVEKCKELMQSRDGILGEHKKVKKRVQGAFRKMDRVLGKVCK